MITIIYKIFPFLRPKRKNPFRAISKRIAKCEKSALKHLNSKKFIKKLKKLQYEDDK